MEMTVEEAVKMYDIRLENTDALHIINGKKAKKDGAVNWLKSHKAEIVSFLSEQKKAEEDAYNAKQAKINAIPGLKELEKADDEWFEYRKAFNSAFDSEDAAIIQSRLTKPASDPEALRKAYPQAAAYLKMIDLSNDVNFEYAAIGEKAVEMVINGDWQKALDFAEAEKDKLAEKHIWD